MSTTQDEFLKYREKGAYHWGLTYTGGWRRSSPSAHARYDVLLDRVAARVPLASSRGLDIGCGDGVMLYKASLRGGRAAGVEMDPTGLELAGGMLRRHGVHPALTRASAYALPFPDGSLDWVTLVEVLEHLDDTDTLLGEVRRVLRPGGVVGLTTPHRLESGIPQDPYHCREYSGPELRSLMERFFTGVKVEGQYPRGFSRVYHQGVGVRPVDLAVRSGVKLASAVGLNPFLLWTTRTPSFAWEGLVGVGVRG
jgi:SAM-dependent methyltransferase